MASADGHLESNRPALFRLVPKYKIMEVNFISGAASEIPLRQAAARPTPTPPAAAADAGATDFDTSNSISQSFSQTAASRADKVARANELLSDPSYPSGAVLNQLAGFLAKRL
jgi:hypothetical protein